MIPDLQTSVKWALRATGATGMILGLATLPTVWAVMTGQAKLGVMYEADLPAWVQWHNVSATGAGLVLMGAICALLIVSGRWPARVLAVVGVAVSIYSKAAFSGTSYWLNWMAVRADGTPYSVVVAVLGFVLFAVSITALAIASKFDHGATESAEKSAAGVSG